MNATISGRPRSHAGEAYARPCQALPEARGRRRSNYRPLRRQTHRSPRGAMLKSPKILPKFPQTAPLELSWRISFRPPIEAQFGPNRQPGTRQGGALAEAMVDMLASSDSGWWYSASVATLALATSRG